MSKTLTWRFKAGDTAVWVSPLDGTRYQIEIMRPIYLKNGDLGYAARMEMYAGTGIFQYSEVADDKKLVGS